MCQALPFDGIKFDTNFKFEDISNTLEDSDIGYTLQVFVKNPHERKLKTKNFSFAAQNKNSPHDNICKYLNEMKPDTYTKNKKINLWLDW